MLAEPRFWRFLYRFTTMQQSSLLPFKPQATLSPDDFRTLSSDDSVDLYSWWLQSRGFSRATIKTYRSWVKKFLIDCCERAEAQSGLPLEAQMRELIIGFNKRLVENNEISVQSTNNVISALCTYCRYLQIEPPEIKREAPVAQNYRFLNEEEMKKIVEIALDSQTVVRDRAILLMFLEIGLSLRNCRLLNRGDLSYTNQGFQLIYGPNNQRKSVHVSGSSLLAKALIEWVDERSPSTNEKSLFVTRTGERLSASSFELIIRKIGWKARIPLSVKLLRDTHRHFKKQAQTSEISV